MPAIDFQLQTTSSTPIESKGVAGITAARVGKWVNDGEQRPIEDNGVGISDISSAAINQADAQAVLAGVFEEVRDERNPAYRGTGIVRNRQAGCTAAMAVATMEGVTIRGAGDAIVVAVGDNGKVIVLNQLHTGRGQAVTNHLAPSGKGYVQDHESFRSWESLERELRARNVRIAVMSDGISGSHASAEIAQDVETLIRKNRISFDDPNWAQRIVEVASTDDAQYSGFKNDDRIVVSTKRPSVPSEQAIIGAFDGIGSGYYESAQVAHIAVELTKELTAYKFGISPRLGVASSFGIPPLVDGLDLARPLKWEGMNSPREGIVKRADASNLNEKQRTALIKALREIGIQSAKIIFSETFQRDYLQIQAHEFPKLGATAPDLDKSEWVHINSPREGYVVRTDVDNLSQQQRDAMLEQARTTGFQGAKIVFSPTFQRNYLQIPAAEFSKLGAAAPDLSKSDWVSMNSPREGSVVRADVNDLSQQQRNAMLEQARTAGIQGAKIVFSETFQRHYLQIPAAESLKLATPDMPDRRRGISAIDNKLSR